MKEFHKILQPYFDKLYPTPTFEVFIERFELDIPAEDLVKPKIFMIMCKKQKKMTMPMILLNYGENSMINSLSLKHLKNTWLTMISKLAYR